MLSYLGEEPLNSAGIRTRSLHARNHEEPLVDANQHAHQLLPGSMGNLLSMNSKNNFLCFVDGDPISIWEIAVGEETGDDWHDVQKVCSLPAFIQTLIVLIVQL